MSRSAAFIFKRLSYSFIQIWVIVSVTFFILHALPGDPFFNEKGIHEEVKKELLSKYNLDKPLYIQYLSYSKALLKGDFGFSIRYPGKRVSDFIRTTFTYSLDLGINALILALLFGFLIGVIGALNEKNLIGSLTSYIPIIILSVPVMVIAYFIQTLFAVWLKILPIGQYVSLKHKILPALSLALVPMAVIIRMIKASIEDILSKDYITTAKAKGLPTHKIVFDHCLRNASLPVISYIGRIFASIITGAFIIEKIFIIPGLGEVYLESIETRDYPMVLGLTIFYSFILIISMTISDLLAAYMDPRLSKGRA